MDLPLVSLAQSDASLGKGDKGNFVEVSEKNKEEAESSEVDDADILVVGADNGLGVLMILQIVVRKKGIR